MRTLVLAADMTPRGDIPVARAIKKIFKQKAFVVESHPTRMVRSVSSEFPLPLTIAMTRHVKLPAKYYGPAPITNRNLFLRDSHLCAYCGRTSAELKKKEYLTRDHIQPTSRGGLDVWDNIVTACNSCNNVKANRTPEEAGLHLIYLPKAITLWQVNELLRDRKSFDGSLNL